MEFTYFFASAGWRHACARYQSGTGSCWGDNANFALGSSSGTQTAPTPVVSLANVTQLWVSWRHNCVIANGIFQCWGEGGMGQLGNKSKGDSPSPVTPSW